MNIFSKIWYKITNVRPKRSVSAVEIESTVAGVWDNSHDIEHITGIIKSFEQEEQKRIIASINHLKVEIQKLDVQKKKLEEKLSSIKTIDNQDISVIDASIKKLNQYAAEKVKQKPKIRIFKPESTDSFDAILRQNNLLKQFQDREIARKEKEERHKKEVRKTLEKISTLLDQDKLDEAKALIISIQNKIKSSYKQEIERLEKSQQKLKDREEQILVRRQLEEQRRRDEEVKRLKEIEKQRQKEIQLQEEQERIAKLEKAKQERLKLEKLLEKKENWQDFQKVLQQNNITTLYHFTCYHNIKSIKEHGGLYSWDYCDKNHITIPCSGGSPDSRGNDATNGKVDFVRIAFTKEHPMRYVAERDGRIHKAEWLEISPEVVYFEDTEYADKNAAAFSSYKANIGKTINHLKNVRFDILNRAKQVKHYDLDDSEKPYNQAEVLVKTWIPIEYITNINNF